MLVLYKYQTFLKHFLEAVSSRFYATSESNKYMYMYHYGSTYM